MPQSSSLFIGRFPSPLARPIQRAPGAARTRQRAKGKRAEGVASPSGPLRVTDDPTLVYSTPLSFGFANAALSAADSGKFMFTPFGGIGLVNHFA